MEECYACMVGVWTGPESHSEGCSLARRTESARVEHVVKMFDTDDDERTAWECSCGRSGSAASWKVDEASDRHIREAGGSRIDRYPGNSRTYSRHTIS